MPAGAARLLAQLRELIRDAAPGAAEEWKWNTPVWSQNGNIVAVGAFQDHVKVNFFGAALLDDSHGLFNAGLEAKASPARDLREGDRINTAALKDLVRAAAATQRRQANHITRKARVKPVSNTSSAAKKRLAAGYVLTVLVGLFLIFDTVIKVLRLAPAIQGTTELGYPADSVLWIGLIELVCVVLYLAPPTSVLGALRLTGYLGGAIATHVRAGSPRLVHTLCFRIT